MTNEQKRRRLYWVTIGIMILFWVVAIGFTEIVIQPEHRF